MLLYPYHYFARIIDILIIVVCPCFYNIYIKSIFHFDDTAALLISTVIISKQYELRLKSLVLKGYIASL